MLQVLQHVRDGRTEIADVPAPGGREGGVLVRNEASLISAGTERMVVEFARRSLIGKARERPDLVRQVLDKVRKDGLLATAQAVFARLDEPIPLGYSCAGIVTEAGAGAPEFTPGGRVACAGMGYASHAEVVYVPRNLAVPVPDSVSAEDASYVTVGAIALHGVRTAEVRLGELVVVIGLGLIGQITVQILVASGCRVIGVDTDRAKATAALAAGAIEATASAADAEAIVARLSNGAGADSVLVTAAADNAGPLELAGALARDRAIVTLVGAVKIELPRKVYYEKELGFRLSRSYGPGRYDTEYEERGHDYPIGYVRWTERRNMEEFIRLVAAGKITPSAFTTHRFAIANAHDAYRLLTNPAGQRIGGIVLTYPNPVAPSRSVRAASPSASASASVRIGVVGAGNFAKAVLLPRLRARSDAAIGAVATARGHSASAAAAKFGADTATTDSASVIADPKLNALVVATRHGSHASIVAAGLRAGKAVFCEKPLAIDEAGLSAVLAAIGPQSALMVGFNRRFSGHARAVRASIPPGEAVAVTYRINAGAVPANHWVHDPQDGGGRVIGEVCHFVDLIQFLADDTPVEVFAYATPAATNDTLTVSLRFARGSVGSIAYAAAGDKSFAKERVEVFGGGVSAAIDDFRRSEIWRRGRKRTHGGFRQDKGFDQEIDAFVRLVRDGGSWPIPLESLVATTRTTFAIVESIRTGKAVAIDSSIA